MTYFSKQGRPEFTFGPANVAATGADCCGKPAGCTNESESCLYRSHPLKRAGLEASSRAVKRELRRAIVDAIFKAGDAHPDQRICQVIVNATHSTGPFYVEDSTLLECLREYRKKGQHP